VNRAGAVLCAVLALVACAPIEQLEDAECSPAGEELTYESFGKAFMEEHCQRCHAAGELDRDGAPTNVVFDTHDDVVERADRIYARAAASNSSMPPGPDGPGAEERELLAEWLACGAM
jgi:uncharacterized membrane protein